MSHHHDESCTKHALKRWREERNEALVHVSRNRDKQTLDAWRTIESAIDAEIIRRRSRISSLSEDERHVIALLRDTDLMARETYGFEVEGTVRADFIAHCNFIANALEKLLSANR